MRKLVYPKLPDEKAERKKLIRECDNLWSEKIRSKRRCEHCGKANGLQAHHIVHRRKYALRWDLDNGICLCPACHTLSGEFSAHKTPIEFLDWWGRDKYDILALRKNNRFKTSVVNLRMIKAGLERS